ncbi:MAG: hypothetical protein FWE16_00945 [Firmicutes bacterium]|nr:hypothetical protein [Bacillota bacterium]
MKKKLIWIIPSVIVLIGCMILSSVMFLGWGRSNATEEDFSLTISVRETTVQAGDRIYIDISLKNHTWRAQRISHSSLFFPYIPDVFYMNRYTTGSFQSRIRRNGVLDTGFWNLFILVIPDDAVIGEHELLVESSFSLNSLTPHNRGINLVSNIIKITII